MASEELELRPGETVEMKLSVEEGSRYVGILAAYRDLPETKWRYTIQLTPVELNEADLTSTRPVSAIPTKCSPRRMTDYEYP